MNGDPHIQALTPSECLDYLASARLGRVGLSIRALPAVRPVRFVLTPGNIVFRVPTNSRLHLAARDAVLVFQTDDDGEDSGIGWTVEVQGHCHEVSDPTEIDQMIQLPIPAWNRSPPGDSFLRLPMRKIAGQRVYW